MAHGVCTVGVVHRLLAGEATLEVTPLCTWRDQHGDRFAGADPDVESTGSGFVFESAYRVEGPGYRPAGAWYRGVHHREEAARGLGASEDLWAAGTFRAALDRRRSLGVVATTELGPRPRTPRRSSPTPGPGPPRWPSGPVPRTTSTGCWPSPPTASSYRRSNGPTAVAGYPWFGEWSRDLFTVLRGSLPVHGAGRRGARGAAAGGRQRLGGDARQHRRRGDAGVQHDRRHAVVPARAGAPRRPHRRPRPGGRAVGHGRGHPGRPRGRHPFRHRGRRRDRAAARRRGRMGADLDGRPDRRPTGHAARRLPGRDRGPLDQRAGHRRRPAGPGRAGRSRLVGAAGAGDGVLRAPVRPRPGRSRRRARPVRASRSPNDDPTSSWPPPCRTDP